MEIVIVGAAGGGSGHEANCVLVSAAVAGIEYAMWPFPLLLLVKHAAVCIAAAVPRSITLPSRSDTPVLSQTSGAPGLVLRGAHEPEADELTLPAPHTPGATAGGGGGPEAAAEAADLTGMADCIASHSPPALGKAAVSNPGGAGGKSAGGGGNESRHRCGGGTDTCCHGSGREGAAGGSQGKGEVRVFGEGGS